MSYDQLRHLADSYGLVVMALVFLVLIAWPWRPGTGDANRRAAHMIFDSEERADG